jgi:hypothetical protein
VITRGKDTYCRRGRNLIVYAIGSAGTTFETIMIYQSLEIQGLRGFGSPQTLDLAVPNNKDHGSGLTIVVGENNSGKSTVVEALRYLALTNVSIPEGARNKSMDERVRITLRTDQGAMVVETVPEGGSEMNCRPDDRSKPRRIIALPSRRNFRTYFSKFRETRDSYALRSAESYKRGEGFDIVIGRLMEVATKHRSSFDKVLKKLITPVPHWTIELSDQATYYIKLLHPN